jgi:hypothetical protein
MPIIGFRKKLGPIQVEFCASLTQGYVTVGNRHMSKIKFGTAWRAPLLHTGLYRSGTKRGPEFEMDKYKNRQIRIG